MGHEYSFKLESLLVDAINMAQQFPFVVVHNYDVGLYTWVVTNHRSVAISLAELFVSEDWPFEYQVK